MSLANVVGAGPAREGVTFEQEIGPTGFYKNKP